MKNYEEILVLALIGVLSLQAVSSHAANSQLSVHVRVESFNQSNYSFKCEDSFGNSYNKDWHVRPDSGSDAALPDEAEALDQPPLQTFKHAFKEKALYHVSCSVVNQSNLSSVAKGDLHVDLRNESWTPEITLLSSGVMKATLQCTPSNTTPYWSVVNAETGETNVLGFADRITHLPAKPGLYDYWCEADGSLTSKPLEFFTDKPPYYPGVEGVPVGVTHSWNSVSGGSSSNDSTHSTLNSSNSSGQAPYQLLGATHNESYQPSACYSSVESLPVSCGGVVVSDSFNGCRLVVCDSANGSTTALACDKPDGLNKYFEVYKQSFGPGPEVCFAGFCVGEAGFAKSNDYPVCTNQSSASCNGLNITQSSGSGTVQSLSLTQDLVNGWNLEITVSGFALGADGHVHVYLNEELVGMAYSEWFYLGGASQGDFVKAVLSARNHSETINSSATVTVPSRTLNCSAEDGATPNATSLTPTCTVKENGLGCELLSIQETGCVVASYAEPGMSVKAVQAQACLKNGSVEVSRQFYNSTLNLEVCFSNVCIDKYWGFRNG